MWSQVTWKFEVLPLWSAPTVKKYNAPEELDELGFELLELLLLLRELLLLVLELLELSDDRELDSEELELLLDELELVDELDEDSGCSSNDAIAPHDWSTPLEAIVAVSLYVPVEVTSLLPTKRNGSPLA